MHENTWLDATGLVTLPSGVRARGRRLADPASPADFAVDPQLEQSRLGRMTDTVTAADRPDTKLVVRRVLIGLQAFFWAFYFIGGGLLLAVAAVQNDGLTFWPFADDGDARDPKNVLGTPGMILYLPILLGSIFGTLLAGAVALAGVALLVGDKASRTLPLIISTALTIAYTVVQFTPFGRLMQVWILD